MLNSEQRKELQKKENFVKQMCRNNLKQHRNFKWVWHHIRNTTDIENEIYKKK
jgi:hypothetical protein